MPNTAALFTSLRDDWRTPKSLYDSLHSEFRFTYDPCPGNGSLLDGLREPWGKRNFVNPPYSRHLGEWFVKAVAEYEEGNLVVMLVPARTDTGWFHELVLPLASEIRFLCGRLKFDDNPNGRATFPSMIVIYQ